MDGSVYSVVKVLIDFDMILSLLFNRVKIIDVKGTIPTKYVKG